jgi:sensor histidine kinase YesM
LGNDLSNDNEHTISNKEKEVTGEYRKQMLIWGQVLFWLSSLVWLLIAKPIYIGLLSYDTGSMQWFLVIATVLNIVFVYSLFFLIIEQRFTSKANYPIKLLLMSITLFVAVVIAKWGLYEILVYLWLPNEYPGLDRRELFFSLIFSVPYLVLAACAGLYVKWARERQYSDELKHRATDAELHLLQHQLQPHFLFNALNTLYGLAVQEGADKTSEATIMLSNLMRHSLAANSQPQVSLAKELVYLEDYFAFQKLRLPQVVANQVELTIEGNPEGWQVPPLLFISYVENAFKYGIDISAPEPLRCLIKINDESVYFCCSNGLYQQEAPSDGHQVGLNNANRRIALHYPNRHTLFTDTRSNQFVVEVEFRR